MMCYQIPRISRSTIWYMMDPMDHGVRTCDIPYHSHPSSWDGCSIWVFTIRPVDASGYHKWDWICCVVFFFQSTSDVCVCTRMYAVWNETACTDIAQLGGMVLLGR